MDLGKGSGWEISPICHIDMVSIEEGKKNCFHVNDKGNVENFIDVIKNLRYIAIILGSNGKEKKYENN